WIIAAPASAAPTAASVISAGVIGRCGDIDGVWIDPVTAQVMITLRGADLALVSVITVSFVSPSGWREMQRSPGNLLGRVPGLLAPSQTEFQRNSGARGDRFRSSSFLLR